MSKPRKTRSDKGQPKMGERKTRKDKGKPRFARWWEVVNNRRHELINKMYFGETVDGVYKPPTDEQKLAPLTEAERKEYEAINERMDAEMERVLPTRFDVIEDMTKYLEELDGG